MVTLNEGQHMGEFLVSEANGTLSREEGTLKNNQDLVDGTVLMLDGDSELVEHDGVVLTDGTLETDVAGILLGNHDTTANGPGGNADKKVAYIARLAEVKDELLNYPATGEDEVRAALLAKNIRTR